MNKVRHDCLSRTESKADKLSPAGAVHCDVQHRAATRNFPVVAEKSRTQGWSIMRSAMCASSQAFRQSNGGKSQKSRPAQFPESKQPFCVRHRQGRMAPGFSRPALLSRGCRLLLLVLEQVRLASRTSRCGAIVATVGRTGRRCTMRVTATRTAVAVSLGRGHAGRAQEDCRNANQVKYFHCSISKEHA
jgi:hypothetical protein